MKIKILLSFLIVATLSFFCTKLYNTEEESATVNTSTLAEVNPLYTLLWDKSIPTIASNYNTGSGQLWADTNFVYYKQEQYDLNVGGTHEVLYIYKFENNGTQRWRSGRLGINASNHNPITVYNGYVLYNEDQFVRLNTNDGTTKGYLSGADYFGRVAGSGIYGIMTSSQQTETLNNLGIKAVELSTRLYRWGYTIPTARAYDNNKGALAVDGDIYYAPLILDLSNMTYDLTYSGLYCFSPSGSLKWKIDNKPTSAITAQDGKVWMIANSTMLQCYQDGMLLWSATISGRMQNQPPVILDSLLVIPTSNGVEAFDKNTGENKWKSPINAGITYAPFSEDNTVIAASDEHIIATSPEGFYVLDKSGNTIEFNPYQYRLLNPTVAGGMVYFNADDPNVRGSGLHKVIAYKRNDYNLPTPPKDSIVVDPPPPPPTPIASVTLTANGNILNWTTQNITTINSQWLQLKSKGSWNTIYTGNPPKQVSRGTYRVIINSNIFSNEVNVKR